MPPTIRVSSTRMIACAYCLLLLLCAILLALPQKTEAAVAFDAVGPSSAGAGSSSGPPTPPPNPITWSHTTSGNNRLLVVSLAFGISGGGSAPTVSVTYGGVTMMSFGRVHTISGEDDSDTSGFVEMFYLVAPPKGTNTVSVTFNSVNGTMEAETGSISFTGVDQTNPIAHSNSGIGNSGAPSISVTSAVGNMVVDILGSGTTITGSGGSQSNRWLKNVDSQTGAGNGAQSTRNGAASPVTMSYTTGNDVWGLIALDLHSAPTLVKPPNNLGLVGYWSFNEGTGTQATDFSGNGNTGLFPGGAADPSWTTGKRGKALRFDGASNYATIHGVANDVQTGAASFALWFKPDIDITASAVSGATLVSVSDLTSDNDLRLRFEQVGSADPGALDWLTIHNEGATVELASTNRSWKAGIWYHVVGTISADGSNTKLYINGALDNQDTGLTVRDNDSPSAEAYIGRLDNGTEPFPGVIDEVRIYNRELGAAEITKLYNSGAVKLNTNSAALDDGSSLERGLVGLWTFDGADVTSNLIVDRSAQGNNGGFFGGATSSATTIGKLGQALKFNGTTNYVSLGAPASLDVPACTIAMWVKTTNDNDEAIFSAGGEGQTGFNVELGPSEPTLTDELITVFSLTTGLNIGYTTSNRSELFDGAWHHVVVTADDTQTKIYLDGASKTMSVGGGTDSGDCLQQNTWTTVRIGGQRYFGSDLNFFNGSIDDVRFYNRALTAAEVKQLYQLGTTKMVQ